jgi:exodeoxyribonuclease X
MNKLLFLDVETTGKEEEDRLCQIAFKRQGDGKKHIGNSKYFKPPLPISVGAMSVTHITNTMVENKEPFQGSTLEKEMKVILEDYILIAHNAQFDIKMLEKEGVEVPRHICSLKLAQTLDPKGEMEQYKLQYLRYHHRLKTPKNLQAHDALSDVLVLEAYFNQVLVKEFTIEEMMEISSKPVLLPKWMFGKHKGELFSEAVKDDLDYYMWARRNMSNLDDNMVHTLNYWINNR